MNVEKLIKRLDSKNAKKRLDAVEGLAAAADTGDIHEIIPILIDCLRDPNDSVVNKAGVQLCKICYRDPDLFRDYIGIINQELHLMLTTRWQDQLPSYGAHVGLVNIISIVGERHPELAKECVPTLMLCLKYPVYHPENPHGGLDKLYSAAVRTFGVVGKNNPDRIVTAIPLMQKSLIDSFKYKSLQTPDPNDPSSLRNVSKASIEAVGKNSADLVVSSMIVCLTNEHKPVRDYGASVLEKLFAQPQKTLPALASNLEDRKTSIRNAATETLEKYGKKRPNDVVPFLIKCLSHPNKTVRIHSAFALGNIGKYKNSYTKRAIVPMGNVLRTDKVQEARQTAADSLFKMAEKNPKLLIPIVPDMVFALRDSYHHVRWRVATIFGMIGKTDRVAVKDAVPILVEFNKDPHEHVRWRGAAALKNIDVTRSEYMIAMKGLEHTRAILDDMRRLGYNMDKAETLYGRALSEFDNMEYQTSIKSSEECKKLLHVTQAAGVQVANAPSRIPGDPEYPPNLPPDPTPNEPPPTPTRRVKKKAAPKTAKSRSQKVQPEAELVDDRTAMEYEMEEILESDTEIIDEDMVDWDSDDDSGPEDGMKDGSDESSKEGKIPDATGESKTDGDRFCPYCGFANKLDYNFCAKCRKALPKN